MVILDIISIAARHDLQHHLKGSVQFQVKTWSLIPETIENRGSIIIIENNRKSKIVFQENVNILLSCVVSSPRSVCWVCDYRNNDKSS